LVLVPQRSQIDIFPPWAKELPMGETNLLFSRSHPLVSACETAWTRTQKAYAGVRAYLDTALIQHMTESDPSFEERKSRAYYVNLPRKIAPPSAPGTADASSAPAPSPEGK
jgi:hypothetical protein